MKIEEIKKQIPNKKALNLNNTSGYRGVSYRKKENKFRAQIKINNKTFWLGWFDTAEEASKCYESAKKELT